MVQYILMIFVLLTILLNNRYELQLRNNAVPL